MDFLKDIVKEIGDDFTKLASDIDETETYVDTGSYIFNALVSGSIFGGVSGNKITAIAGESSTGKTFFSLAVVKNFLIRKSLFLKFFYKFKFLKLCSVSTKSHSINNSIQFLIINR